MKTFNYLNRFSLSNALNIFCLTIVILVNFKLTQINLGTTIINGLSWLFMIIIGVLISFWVKLNTAKRGKSFKLNHLIMILLGLICLIYCQKQFSIYFINYLATLFNQQNQLTIYIYDFIFILPLGIYLGLLLNKLSAYSPINIRISLIFNTLIGLTYLIIILPIFGINNTLVFILTITIFNLFYNNKQQTLSHNNFDLTLIGIIFKVNRQRLVYLFVLCAVYARYLYCASKILLYNFDNNIYNFSINIILICFGLILGNYLKTKIFNKAFNFFANLQTLTILMSGYLLLLILPMKNFTLEISCLNNLTNYLIVSTLLLFAPSCLQGIAISLNFVRYKALSQIIRSRITLLVILTATLLGLSLGLNSISTYQQYLHISGIKFTLFIASIVYFIIACKANINIQGRLLSQKSLIIIISYITTSYLVLNHFLLINQPQYLMYYFEGINSIINIEKGQNLNILKLDNKVQASIPNDLTQVYYGSDITNQILLSVLPVVNHNGKIANALIIGYGSGTTTKALQTIQRAGNITVCDTQNKLFFLDKYFNLNIFKTTANVALIKKFDDDIRYFLALSQKKYNLIISQPSEPNSSGSYNLYSKEFFKITSQHLDNDGIICQWVQLYDINTLTLASILDTFRQIFPNTFIYHFKNAGEIILIGLKNPQAKINIQQYLSNIHNHLIQNLLAPFDLNESGSLIQNLALTPTDIIAFTHEFNPRHLIITDNKNYLEYAKANSNYLIDDNLSALTKNASLDLKPYFSKLDKTSLNLLYNIALTELMTGAKVNNAKLSLTNMAKLYYSIINLLPDNKLFKDTKILLKNPNLNYQNFDFQLNPYTLITLINLAIIHKDWNYASKFINVYLNNYALAWPELTPYFYQKYLIYCYRTNQYRLGLALINKANLTELARIKYTAMGYYYLQDYNQAIQWFALYLTTRPNDFNLRTIYSSILLSKGQAYEALMQLQYCHEIRPNNNLPFILSNLYYLKLNNINMAQLNLDYLRNHYSKGFYPKALVDINRSKNSVLINKYLNSIINSLALGCT